MKVVELSDLTPWEKHLEVAGYTIPEDEGICPYPHGESTWRQQIILYLKTKVVELSDHTPWGKHLEAAGYTIPE